MGLTGPAPPVYLTGMKVLILTFGSRGDVQPYVALGAALRKRGHAVTLATGQGFEAMVEGQGLTPAPLSVDVRALVESPEMKRALRSLSGKIRAWRDSKQLARRLLEETWSIACELRPDVIVYNVKALTAPHIAEALRCIAVPAFQIPAFAPTGDFANPLLPVSSLGRAVNRLSYRALVWLTVLATSGTTNAWRRERLGLAPDRARNPVAGYHPKARAVGRLHGYSRHIVPKPDDWGAEEQVTGYWFLDRGAAWEPPRELARFLEAGPPPVYVGFGSMPAEDGGGLMQTFLDGFEAFGGRAVLARGWGGFEGGALTDKVHVLDAAPHDWLFPRCSAVIHHGGAGTTHEGLRWGRPSLVCPVFGDQPYWGRRVQELGAGPAPLPQKRLTTSALVEALGALQRPEVVSRAAEIGAAIRGEPGAEAAASAIDSIVAT